MPDVLLYAGHEPDVWLRDPTASPSTPVAGGVAAAWESSGWISIGSDGVWEGVSRVAPTQGVSYESTQPLSTATAGVWENTGRSVLATAEPWESNAPLSLSRVESWESIQRASQGTLSAFECRSLLRPGTTAFWESLLPLTPVSMAEVGTMDALGRLDGRLVVFWESHGQGRCVIDRQSYARRHR